MEIALPKNPLRESRRPKVARRWQPAHRISTSLDRAFTPVGKTVNSADKPGDPARAAGPHRPPKGDQGKRSPQRLIVLERPGHAELHQNY